MQGLNNEYDTAVIGIDPGIKGGVAALILNDKHEVQVSKVIPMPTKLGAKGKKEIDGLKFMEFIWNVQYNYISKRIACVAIEFVHAMKGQGVTSSFTFGKGYGKLLGIMEGMELTVREVSPVTWQAAILGTKRKPRQKGGRTKSATGATQKRSKEPSIKFVAQTYPDINLIATDRSRKPHDGMAEAVCLAEWARRSLSTAKQG